jgi:phytanoyl-CoA hydroxylase
VHPMVWHRSGRGLAGQRRRAFSACYLNAETKCVRKKGTPRTFLAVF